jgi:hypothetical protein
LGPIFFLTYINDLPKLATIGTKILLYADDTSIIVTNPNSENFKTQIDKIFGDINNWFKTNYQGNYVKNSINTKFLGLIIDDSLSWKAHIDQMMSKLNTLCLVIRMI